MKQHPLWTLLGPSNAAGIPSSSISGLGGHLPPTTAKDKTSTSLRLLLCDTQSTMEGFSSQLSALTKDVGQAKRHIEEAGKLVEDGQAKAAEEVKLLRACKSALFHP